MKQLIKNYSFNATSKTVTLSDFSTVILERLQLIIDVTTNTILYNFADSSVATATVATNVITLSTVGSAAGTDKLMIVYDAAAGDPVYDLPLVGSEPSTSNFSVTTASATSAIDGGNDRWVSVQVTGQGTSSVVNFQGSNDGTNWFSIGLSLAGNTSAAAVSSTNATGIYHGPLPARYFRLNITGISAGTTSGVIVLSSLPTALQAIGGSVAQIGTWNIGSSPNNALADATTNPTTNIFGALDELFNGASWDRKRGNWNTTTGDSGTKTASFNGATQTNYNHKSAYITVVCGTVSGTSPTMTAQLQWSPDGGTTWLNLGPASAAITASNNTIALLVGPDNWSQAAGATPANLTTGATQTVAINAPLPRTWRVAFTIGGTTPSFAITAVDVNYVGI